MVSLFARGVIFELRSHFDILCLMRKYLLFLWNFWPPFWGSGISIVKISKDYRYVKARLKKRPWTANYVGTQYGGSIYSMTDPFYMVMLLMNLGRDFIIWDKSASIRFLKPGKTDLFGEFILTQDILDFIKKSAMQNGKFEWTVTIKVKDKNDVVCAEVEKILWVKYKKYQK